MSSRPCYSLDIDAFYTLACLTSPLPSDLGWGRPVDAIIEGLKRIWDIPLSKGSKVLALTVPETQGKFRDIIEKRGEVNDTIRTYEKENL